MKKTTLFLSLLAIILTSFNSCNTPKEKFIGLQLYSLRDLMNSDPAETVKKVGEMGYAFVEAAGYNDGKFYGMDPAEFKMLVDESGMIFLGSHCGQDIPDSANWDNTMKWWDKCISAHKDGGVEYIVQPFMGKTGYTSLEGLKRYCDYFNEVGKKCNAAGIRFGYHNHSGEFQNLEGQMIYDFMIQNTDAANVMFEMDLYWAIEGGAIPNEYFEKYPGRFWLWHVKDEKEVGASGDIDFAKIWEGKEEAGVKYFVVEQEDYDYEPIESVKMSLDYLLQADFVE